MSSTPESTKRYKPLPPRAQRWSASFPPEIKHFYMAVYGVQMPAPDWQPNNPPKQLTPEEQQAENTRRANMSQEERLVEDKKQTSRIKNERRNARLMDKTAADYDKLAQSPFFVWIDLVKVSRFAPGAFDHSRFFDGQGFINHVWVCYWTSRERFEGWRHSRTYTDFWDTKERTAEDFGYWREEMSIPIDRQEAVYFGDYIVGIASCESVNLVKSFSSGYYGSMRDRIPSGKIDGPDEPLAAPILHDSAHARIQVHPDEFVAMIRSGQYWKHCHGEQREHYFDQLQPAVNTGMDFLRDNPVETGCCSVRYMQNCDVSGKLAEEGTALAYFKTIDNMETWAKSHTSHEKIYVVAKQQLMKKDFIRQLRTYHEVAVLPDYGQFFEYCNCQPMTGLLPYFPITRKA